MAKARSIIQAKYDKEHTKTITIKFNVKYDADIIEKLSAVPSMQGYIKGAIRKVMKLESFLNTDSLLNEDSLLDPQTANKAKEKPNRDVFQENFNELIRSRKIKQNDIARYVGTSPMTISSWKTGRAYPRAEAIEKLCQFFNIDRSSLTERKINAESQEEKLISIFHATSQQGQDKMIERAEELKLLYPKYDNHKE